MGRIKSMSVYMPATLLGDVVPCNIVEILDSQPPEHWEDSQPQWPWQEVPGMLIGETQLDEHGEDAHNEVATDTQLVTPTDLGDRTVLQRMDAADPITLDDSDDDVAADPRDDHIELEGGTDSQAGVFLVHVCFKLMCLC